MICCFWRRDALTAICASISLVFIKTEITSRVISNISIHRCKQKHTHPPPPSISERKTFQAAESGLRRKQGEMKMLNGNNKDAILLHRKRPDCTGLHWWSPAGFLHLVVTKPPCVEMPNIFPYTIVQRLCIRHRGQKASCLTFWWCWTNLKTQLPESPLRLMMPNKLRLTVSVVSLIAASYKEIYTVGQIVELILLNGSLLCMFFPPRRSEILLNQMQNNPWLTAQIRL